LAGPRQCTEQLQSTYCDGQQADDGHHYIDSYSGA
jgi:hypothetical protein